MRGLNLLLHTIFCETPASHCTPHLDLFALSDFALLPFGELVFVLAPLVVGRPRWCPLSVSVHPVPSPPIPFLFLDKDFLSRSLGSVLSPSFVLHSFCAFAFIKEEIREVFTPSFVCTKAVLQSSRSSILPLPDRAAFAQNIHTSTPAAIVVGLFSSIHHSIDQAHNQPRPKPPIQRPTVTCSGSDGCSLGCTNGTSFQSIKLQTPPPAYCLPPTDLSLFFPPSNRHLSSFSGTRYHIEICLYGAGRPARVLEPFSTCYNCTSSVNSLWLDFYLQLTCCSTTSSCFCPGSPGLLQSRWNPDKQHPPTGSLKFSDRERSASVQRQITRSFATSRTTVPLVSVILGLHMSSH